MENYENEEWAVLYREAMLELEHAKVAGRIGEARTEIASRIEKLRDMPGLHEVERQALDDALRNLRGLERVEAQHADAERRAAETALEKLRVIAPKIGDWQ